MIELPASAAPRWRTPSLPCGDYTAALVALHGLTRLPEHVTGEPWRFRLDGAGATVRADAAHLGTIEVEVLDDRGDADFGNFAGPLQRRTSGGLVRASRGVYRRRTPHAALFSIPLLPPGEYVLLPRGRFLGLDPLNDPGERPETASGIHVAAGERTRAVYQRIGD